MTPPDNPPPNPPPSPATTVATTTPPAARTSHTRVTWLKGGERWNATATSATDALSGIWISSGSSVAAEVAASAGFDWALLDLEHGLGSEADLLRQLQAMNGGSAAPVVRVPSATSDMILRVLDYGAAGVMAPHVESVQEAQAFVAALRYPPTGTRGMSSSSRAAGYGVGFKTYYREANTRVAGIVQIETQRGLDALDDIAALDGVDVLFIGHSDLSLALGCFEDMTAPAVVAAEERVLAACARHGKRAGMLLKSTMQAAPYRQRGFSVLALGSDVGCLKSGYAALLAAAAR